MSEGYDLKSKERIPFGQAFARAAAKPTGKSCNDFLDAILNERPDLADQMAYFPTQGGMGYTVFIGDEVFKGPKDDYDLKGFDKEMLNLHSLEGSGLPVPKLIWVGEENFFYSMTRVPGVTAGYDLMETLTPDQQRQLAKDIISFVIGLAKVLPAEDGKFMMHDDLHYNNILIDPETKRLVSVIDFGMMKEVTRDQWRPAWGYAQPFTKMLQEEYDLRKNELPEPVPVVEPEPAPAAAPAATAPRRGIAAWLKRKL